MPKYKINFTCPDEDCPSHLETGPKAVVECIETVTALSSIDSIEKYDDGSACIEYGERDIEHYDDSLPSFACSICSHIFLKDADNNQLIDWLKEHNMLVERK